MIKPNRTHLAAGGTILALGALTAVAIGAQGANSSSAAKKATTAEVRTVVVNRTVKVTKHRKPKNAAAGGSGATVEPQRATARARRQRCRSAHPLTTRLLSPRRSKARPAATAAARTKRTTTSTKRTKKTKITTRTKATTTDRPPHLPNQIRNRKNIENEQQDH